MRRSVLALAALALAGCGGGETVKGSAPKAPDAITLTSPAFTEEGTIPRRFTCDGAQKSPPLRWSGVPAGSAELALLMEDPDAPEGTFVHWVVVHIPSGVRTLETGKVPAGAKQLEQSFGKRSYGGPCPPEDDPPHHYVLTLYSLERRLPVEDDAAPDEVRDKLEDVVTARGRLTAAYGR
jgi:Raf kinase inhibitor-like YbhB/YbcL family protein